MKRHNSTNPNLQTRKTIQFDIQTRNNTNTITETTLIIKGRENSP